MVSSAPAVSRQLYQQINYIRVGSGCSNTKDSGRNSTHSSNRCSMSSHTLLTILHCSIIVIGNSTAFVYISTVLTA